MTRKKAPFILIILSLLLSSCISNLPGKVTSTPDATEIALSQADSTTQSTAVVLEEDALPVGELVWTEASGTRELPAGSSYDDPWDYCNAVGTIDQPGSEYNGENPPAAVKEEVLSALSVSASDGTGHNVVWRCVDNQVMGCDTTMFQHCLTLMDLSTTPKDAVVTECKKTEMNNSTLPSAVVDNDTPYEWTCNNGVPVISGQGISVDEQGYNTSIWYLVPRQ